MLQQDKVYLMSGGKIKVANRQYTSIPHEYEISFDDKAVIQAVTEASDFAPTKYNFVKIAALESLPPNSSHDVVGVVVSAGEAAQIQSKAGKTLKKRDLQLGDETGRQIALTMWGDHSALPISVGDVIAMRGARLGDYGGRSLSTWASTKIDTQADIPEAHMLRGWWAQAGGSVALTSLSEARGSGGSGGGEGSGPLSVLEQRKPLSAIKDEGLGQSGNGDLVVLKAAIGHVRYDDPNKLWYPACPAINASGRVCNKKMMPDPSSGSWSCNSGDTAPAPVYRYILNVGLMDASGVEYVTAFDAEATQLLGMPAKDVNAVLVGEAANDANHPAFTHIFRDVMFKEFLFTLKAKMEAGRDEAKVRTTVIKVRELDYAKESRVLLAAIKKYSGAATA